MHYETLIYIALQACISLNPPRGFAIPDFPSLARYHARTSPLSLKDRHPILSFPTTTISLGHDDNNQDDSSAPYDPEHEFGWDVEHPRRSVEVKEFKIDALPVTNGEYVRWLEQKGEKADGDLFPASWAWKGQPNDAVVGGDQVVVKTLYGEVKLEYAELWPLCGSAVQLEAFAKVGPLLPPFS